jgi:hypothetical protein
MFMFVTFVDNAVDKKLIAMKISVCLDGSLWQRLYDDGGSKHLWNVGPFLPDYTTQRPKDSYLHTRSCDNMTCHVCDIIFSNVI